MYVNFASNTYGCRDLCAPVILYRKLFQLFYNKHHKLNRNFILFLLVANSLVFLTNNENYKKKLLILGMTGKCGL